MFSYWIEAKAKPHEPSGSDYGSDSLQPEVTLPSLGCENASPGTWEPDLACSGALAGKGL